MNRKGISLMLILLMAASMIFAQGGQDSDTIKFGGVWPLGDITGEQASKAAQVAVDEINANGGLLGKQVELIVIDSEFNPEKGAAAIERLATIDKVDFFVGVVSSGVHLGQIPTLKTYKKITMITGAASHLAEEAIGADQEWYFHLHPWDYNQGASYVEGWNAIAEKYSEISIGRWFLAYEEGAFGSASFEATKALFSDMEIDGEPFLSAAAGGGDYSAVLQRAKAYDPDVFIWAGYDADALPLLEQSKAIDFDPALFVGAPPGWPADFGESKLAEDVTLYGLWAPSLNEISEVSAKFYNGFIAKTGTEPATYFAPLGYAAIQIIAQAVEEAGTMDQDAIIAELKKIQYESPTGEVISFGPSNIISNQGIRNQKILQWQNGVQQVIWPFEQATSEPKYPFTPWSQR
ncbi:MULTISPECIES: ABC transporter substrate-binding protein [unclassified Oceanispirochaeta]|uniref:ABC transporter substrate-binding protein n=1 Tax=unclassified Oceanispirochaeta TaxID=2635722 RepID=UPI000E09497C|nr:MULTISPECIES: ABC transporter substrate-binding protein [unclassified Oceanispirochaeta]MBF9018157.1 ABC transporter substrate-binding protein [Oceanispirochaeta sp. M2]NPD74621.1 ABC transporter substrate-binding protein [Oceanispirochaeta sp. M1]RDG29572.1 ABC transporter substrate-binding protein [Oceanispirochaeta sp. M1]